MHHPTSTLRERPGATPHPWRVFAALVTTLLVGCTDRPLGGGDGDGGGTSTGQSAATSTSAGSIEPTAPTSGAVGTTGGGVTSGLPGTSTGPGEPPSICTEFGPDPDCSFLGCDEECPDCNGTHQLDPECPDGQKCTVDGSIGETHCVEIAPEPKGLYEPCTSMGDLFDGLDDCGLGMLCWNVNERGQGICIGMCDGPESDIDCVCADPKATPSWCQSCAVGLCFPNCDPLLQDCQDDDLCIPNGDAFVCVLDASGDEGQANDPCEFANVCDKGLVCLDPATVSASCEPAAGGCCTPFCEFPGGACPNPDQTCVQWFDPESVPEGSEHIGVCIIPQ